MGRQLHMPARTAEQLQLLERQAIVDSGQIILVLLRCPAQPMALGGGLGRLGRAGHHQAEVVQLGQAIGAVGAQVHEPQALGPGRGGLAPQAHRPAIDRPHRHDGIEVQTVTPPEPLPPQLRQGLINRGAGHKAHIVQLDVAPGGSAAQHHQKQIRALAGHGRRQRQHHSMPIRTMSERSYIHGTSEREQQRLIEQAAGLSDLLAANLELQAGERLLEIGCGVGAVLGQIAQACPEARLSGIDISAEQIDGARRHLADLGLDPEDIELVVGDGAALPWPDQHFDRVRVVWVLEHLSNPLAVLREARQVLRPGGTIHLTETDYGSLRVSPPDGAIDALLAAFVAHFNRHGDAHAGPRLGPLLSQAGFAEVDVQMLGLHHWCPGQRQQLQEFCTYLLGFIGPELPALRAAAADAETAALIDTGAERFAQLAERSDGAISVSVYQGRGVAPG